MSETSLADRVAYAIHQSFHLNLYPGSPEITLNELADRIQIAVEEELFRDDSNSSSQNSEES